MTNPTCTSSEVYSESIILWLRDSPFHQDHLAADRIEALEKAIQKLLDEYIDPEDNQTIANKARALLGEK